jgi:hypothetical protein
MKFIWTDRRLFAGLFAMTLLALLAWRSSSSVTGDFIWAIVTIVGVIGGSNAWQAAQVAKHGKSLGVNVNVREEEQQQPKTSKREQPKNQ